MSYTDSLIKKIRFVISSYKENFGKVNEGERFKWEAIGCYKKHWNIEADDFAAMMELAFSKARGLLASGMYYPYKVLQEFANEHPEAVRRLFYMLHDETVPLVQRYIEFRRVFEERLRELKDRDPAREKALQHYQDLRAIMVYLTFEYPERYYLYKYTMYSKFRDRISFVEEQPAQKSVVWKVENYTRMCDAVLEVIRRDDELIAMSKWRLDDDCYQDEALHLLTMDVVYYGSNYMSEEDFAGVAEETSMSSEYWPSLEEYDPSITEEMWSAVLLNPAVTSPKNLDMLMKMLELGGESTCAHLAEVYGNTHSYYNKLGSSFGEKVKKHYNCPDCVDLESDTVSRNRVYVVPFVGRDVVENGYHRYSWKLREELKAALMGISIVEPAEEPQTDLGLNTILYGPPGTGKTYHTVIYAVAIIENKRLDEVLKEDYADVLERYHEYKAQGRVEFTTFHQSYGYEEFIEGIKPVVVSRRDDQNQAGEVQYRVEAGVFKRFCESATSTGRTFDEAWSSMIAVAKNDKARYTFFRRTGSEINAELRDDETFVVQWKGQTQSKNTLKKDRAYAQWIKADYSIRDTLSGGTRWEFDAYQAIIDELQQRYSLRRESQKAAAPQNYVFIIDEINRGNISKIFGELITLIEASKRVGEPESMKAVLPYSQKPFGVPKNVYIIGTMNTADRSIATIDTALRRRFYFKEMLPNAKVLADISVEDIPIGELLLRMNKRITVLYDREHMIGHAYFMPLKASPTIETLAHIFANNIIPLLQEYFYEDYEKIRLVLGDNCKNDESEQFIVAKTNDYEALFGDVEIGIDDSCNYEINYAALENIEAYRSI